MDVQTLEFSQGYCQIYHLLTNFVREKKEQGERGEVEKIILGICYLKSKQNCGDMIVLNLEFALWTMDRQN